MAGGIFLLAPQCCVLPRLKAEDPVNTGQNETRPKRSLEREDASCNQEVSIALISSKGLERPHISLPDLPETALSKDTNNQKDAPSAIHDSQRTA